MKPNSWSQNILHPSTRLMSSPSRNKIIPGPLDTMIMTLPNPFIQESILFWILILLQLIQDSAGVSLTGSSGIKTFYQLRSYLISLNVGPEEVNQELRRLCLEVPYIENIQDKKIREKCEYAIMSDREKCLDDVQQTRENFKYESLDSWKELEKKKADELESLRERWMEKKLEVMAQVEEKQLIREKERVAKKIDELKKRLKEAKEELEHYKWPLWRKIVAGIAFSLSVVLIIVWFLI